MVRLLLVLLLVSPAFQSGGQYTEAVYPKTLLAPNDTFYVSFSAYPKLYPKTVSGADTTDMGTDGAPGMVATIYFGNDSVNIAYENLPYAQVHYIPIQSNKGKTVYRLHFNNITCNFPAWYMEQNRGKVQVEIPEVYELANIIWMLSPNGQRATDLYKEGPYYQKVLSNFQAYLTHPVFTKLDFPDSLYALSYYDFRENSFTYNFKGDKLVYEGPYYYVMGGDWDNYNSLFKQLVPLVEDFARQSGFREFYRSNTEYYKQQIKRQEELMPVKNMWQWLEEKFPDTKYQSYKIVFSPLIGGSHSTQNFATYYKGSLFRESVMFVCGPDRYDQSAELSEKQKEGLLSGVVFTEIDHNYVNRVSYKFKKTIDSIFQQRDMWVRPGDGSSKSYSSSLAVFNEYMTHSLFCLWVQDNYDKDIADFVIAKRESLMVDRRDFIKFREFNKKLFAISKDHRGKTMPELYPLLLAACREVD